MMRIFLLWLILCGCPTALRTFDCVLGKYKQNDVCKPCPRSCSRCISDVICIACKPGFYGNICREQCSDSCSDRKCLQENGQCVSCAVGHYFSSNKTCVKCPDHCTYCQSRDICTACEIGFTGIICNEECTNCNPVSGCNIETKVCFAGCKNGYSSPTCVKRCASKCKSCEPVDASKCTSCASDRHGYNCENKCPTMCRDFKCNDVDGNCIQGCQEGFWGNKCEKMCPINCRQGVCHQMNGSCSNSCQGDFTGNMCRCPSDCECESDETCEKCSTNSSFVCDKQCSEFCIGSICSFDTQHKCLYGCREGYRGIRCGSSDSQNYSEEESNTSTVIVVIVIMAVIILVTVVIIIKWRKRLYRLNCKRSDDYRSAEAEAPEMREMIDRKPSMRGNETDSVKQTHEKLLELAQSIDRKTDKEYQTESDSIPKVRLECDYRTPPGPLEAHDIAPLSEQSDTASKETTERRVVVGDRVLNPRTKLHLTGDLHENAAEDTHLRQMKQTDTYLEMDNTPQDAANRYVLGTGQHTSSFPSEKSARSMKTVSRYDVCKPDEDDCYIEGCCILPNDEILLLDSMNRHLMKLDASYRVTSTCKLSPFVKFDLTSLTYIGNSEAVVCAQYTLVYVNVSGNMSVRKIVKLDTYCRDVTCSNDRLYVLYETFIHICTLEGDIISVLPLEVSGDRRHRLAVGDDGQMYVTDYGKGLITLDSSGNVISTLPDVDTGPVCVDDRGNVWAARYYSKVYQISADGSQILNTLSLNIVGNILSLCYDKHRSSLIICGYSKKISAIGFN